MKKTLVLFFGALGLLALALFLLVPDFRVTIVKTFIPGCLTEQLEAIPDIHGVRFEVVYENCDTLAKEERVFVYASEAGAPMESWFDHWFHHTTPILVYDPGYPAEKPSIEVSGGNTIHISIDRVSSINCQTHQWRDLHIDYRFARVDYPPETAEQAAYQSGPCR